MFPMCLIIKEKHKSQWPLRYHDQKLSVIEISIDLTFLFSFQKKIKKKKMQIWDEKNILLPIST